MSKDKWPKVEVEFTPRGEPLTPEEQAHLAHILTGPDADDWITEDEDFLHDEEHQMFG